MSSTHPPLHPQLRQIRLLRISAPDAGEINTKIHCSLSCFFLDIAPPYTALSYTWGSGNTVAISLQGHDFEVGENLATYLLHHRRHSDPEAFLWVDAICIDQKNIPEKNRQVPLMNRIYSLAKSVVVWLGQGRGPSGALNYTVQCISSPTFLPIFPDETMTKCLLRLFNDPYWSRIWIIQEIMLAKNVTIRCGEEQAEWGQFTDFAKICQSRFETRKKLLAGARKAVVGNAQAFKNLQKMVDSSAAKIVRHKIYFDRNSERKGKAFSLASLMQEFRHSKASVFHDKVFALCGLVRHGATIEIDYGLSKDQLFDKLVHLVDVPLLDYGSATTRHYREPMNTITAVLEMPAGEVVKCFLYEVHAQIGCAQSREVHTFLQNEREVNKSELNCPTGGTRRGLGRTHYCKATGRLADHNFRDCRKCQNKVRNHLTYRYHIDP